ncbi:hypothetical protein ACPOL_1043 [Acidisarcina polymorpha]|uniref:Uncharacterized protein n=2 Tax=Acidisarcina polymorpha TaxID=2211140 RepID=A0A2Z5FV67_9BACT|nr:hypothetical protein ACPOL_1043 [Acidisarcina polymorpha]
MSFALAMPAVAAQLSTDARSAIPKDIQQLIAVDYRAMQNSSAAMDLKNRILPPELKQMEEALKTSGLNANHDVDELAFASFRVSGVDGTRMVGIAQGEFDVPTIKANWLKKKVKYTKVRTNRVYPMGTSGMSVTFVNPTTMIFGSEEAVKSALDARDGVTSSLLNNNSMMESMQAVDTAAVWSVLDQEGTQFMMHSVLGQASQVTDYDTVKKRFLGSRYMMDFSNGVKFNLNVQTPDAFTAGTMASLLNAAALYKKMSGTDAEKQAIGNTTVKSDADNLEVNFSASDSQFVSLLQSPLFQAVVH